MITATGALLLGLGILLLPASRKGLYLLTVFFTPFTATAILNVSSGFWLTPFQWFGALWLLREAASLRFLRSPDFAPAPRMALLGLALLAASSLLSVFMPALIDGGLQIQSPLLDDPASIPLRLTHTNFSRLVYLGFGMTVTLFMLHSNREFPSIRASLRAFTAAAAFTSLWGIFQFACAVFDLPYPAVLFNNSENAVAQGFTQTLPDVANAPLTRISSVAVEPSIFAQYLLSALPLLAGSLAFRAPIWGRRRDAAVAVVVLASLLLSTSSTAYVGLALAALVTLSCSLLAHGLKFRHALLLGLGAAITSAVYLLTPNANALIARLVLAKAAEGSGLERLQSVYKAWGYFVEYPILGIGWGSVTCHDLVVQLLSSAGVIGLLSFAILASGALGSLGAAILRARRSVDPTVRAIRGWGTGLLASLATLILVQGLTGFAYYFGYFWVVLGLALAATGSLSHAATVRRGPAFDAHRPPAPERVVRSPSALRPPTAAPERAP